MEENQTPEEKPGNIVYGYCDGCSKINADSICTVYANPTAKCRIGCAFSPAVKEKAKPAEKKRAGQQKQKKKK